MKNFKKIMMLTILFGGIHFSSQAQVDEVIKGIKEFVDKGKAAVEKVEIAKKVAERAKKIQEYRRMITQINESVCMLSELDQIASIQSNQYGMPLGCENEVSLKVKKIKLNLAKLNLLKSIAHNVSALLTSLDRDLISKKLAEMEQVDQAADESVNEVTKVIESLQDDKEEMTKQLEEVQELEKEVEKIVNAASAFQEISYRVRTGKLPDNFDAIASQVEEEEEETKVFVSGLLDWAVFSLVILGLILWAYKVGVGGQTKPSWIVGGVLALLILSLINVIL